MGGDMKKCQECGAKCCKYVTIPLVPPEDDDDFDNFKWIVCHQGVSIFFDESGWNVMVETPCRYLKSDNSCGIYKNRPGVCRHYTYEDCANGSDEFEFEIWFKSPEEIETYQKQLNLKKKSKKESKKKSKKKKNKEMN